MPDAATLNTRTVSSVASDGVAYFVYWLVILMLLGQAIASLVRPAGGPGPTDVATSVICLLWATFCLGLGMRRAKRPDGVDLPPPAGLGVVTTAGCLLSLEMVRVATGTVGEGPGQSELLLGGLFVGSVTVWRGALAGGVSAGVLAFLALVLPLRWGGHGPLLTSWPADVVPSISMLAAGFSLALALVALGRAARGLQRTLDARDAALVREHAVKQAATMAAEVERSLHDTALNTLETIAAHGDHLDPAVVARRCRWDHEQLSRWRQEADVTDLGGVTQALEEHARRLGLGLDAALIVDPSPSDGPAPDPPDIPVPVLSAVAGAAREALTNVAKHARVTTATLLVRRDREGVQVFVADAGAGAERATPGFGVTRSIRERMESVGGQAVTGPGPDGRGTVVVLQWLRQEPPTEEIASQLLWGTARIVLIVATFLAGTASALIILGWPAYARGWLALAGALAPVLMAASLVERARAGRGVGPDQVLAACGTYLLVGALAQLADPYCSALLGEGVLLDVRPPMMAVLLLLAPRPGVLAASLVTVLGSHLTAAAVWNSRWILCGPETAQAGVYVVAALAACWLFVVRIDRLTVELAGARQQEIQAQVRIRAELSIRAEEELWVADTLRRAQDLLHDLAVGRRRAGDPATRDTCAGEAQRLRAWLALGAASPPLRRAARDWLRGLAAHDCGITVRGSFGSVGLPEATIASIGQVIGELCRSAPGSQLTLAAWPGPDPMVVLSAVGSGVAGAGAALAGGVDGAAPGSWVDVGPEGLTVQWAVAEDVPGLAARSG